MQNKEVYDELVAKFEKMYGEKPQVVAYAPGRIEVLGNHTDYNEGYVFSAAIDKGTFFAVSPTADESCELTAGDFMETAKFTIGTVAPAKEMTWQNYVTGTFNWLFDGNPAAAKHGWKAMFLGNIPLGAGLSSSAALEMCTVLALSKIYGIEKDRTTLAKIGQKAEHTFAGCPCGLLDQASSMYGKAGALVKSDFRTNEFESVPMGDGVAFMMVKSNAKHALVDGAYASRRQACEDAAKYFAALAPSCTIRTSRAATGSRTPARSLTPLSTRRRRFPRSTALASREAVSAAAAAFSSIRRRPTRSRPRFPRSIRQSSATSRPAA